MPPNRIEKILLPALNAADKKPVTPETNRRRRAESSSNDAIGNALLG